MHDHLASSNAEMLAELDTDPVFGPSEFWRVLNEKNLQMLVVDGLDNFKRTVAQNYYSWLITNPLSPHFRHVLIDWLRHPTLHPLLTRIERNVSVRLSTRRDPVRLSARQRLLYRMYVSCIWEKMLRADVGGLASQVVEPEVGNPMRVWRRGRLITQDLANSIVEATVMNEFLPAGDRPRIAEFGAGSGRLAHVVASTRRSTYHVFDIPPALIVSQWYLERILPEKRLFRFRHFDDFGQISAELAESDLAFFTSNQLAKFPAGYFDMVVSISTLPEARPDQVRTFLDLFQRVCSGHIYLKQWRRWRNPLDGTDLRSADYALADSWRLIRDRTDPINPLFFSRVWRRNPPSAGLDGVHRHTHHPHGDGNH
jgi:putative sugar O-methyltransferase